MENEDVVGAAPTSDATTTSEWPTILLPTKVRLILEIWRYVHISCGMYSRMTLYWCTLIFEYLIPQIIQSVFWFYIIGICYNDIEIYQIFTYIQPTLITGDPLHSRAACTQPCNVNTHSRAHCSPGARLCEQWGHGCVNNGARLCASARLCRGSPVLINNSFTEFSNVVLTIVYQSTIY